MILVSFSSAEDVLFNDVKSMTLLDRRVLKIRCSALLGDTRYTANHPFLYNFI